MLKQLFPILFILVFTTMHFVIYKRMVFHSHFKTKTKSILKYLIIVNFLLVLSYIGARYFTDVPFWLYYVSSLSIGVAFVLFLGVLVLECLNLLYRFTPISPKRRDFFKKVGDIGFWSVGTFYVASGIKEGAKEPTIKPIKIKSEKLNQNYRFVQLSDMHIGGLIDEQFVINCVEKVNSLNVDFVFITGDLVDSSISKVKESVRHLKNLKSKFGTFMVVGNHEYFHGIEETIVYLNSINVRVLENEAVEFDGFWLVGVFDIFGFRAKKFIPDIHKATSKINSNKPTILLAHQPKFVNFLDGFKPDVMFCGHTHGGQIFPFHFLVRLDQKYVSGLYQLENGTKLYVNSGIGFWGPPMRLGSTAEITLIEWQKEV